MGICTTIGVMQILIIPRLPAPEAIPLSMLIIPPLLPRAIPVIPAITVTKLLIPAVPILHGISSLMSMSRNTAHTTSRIPLNVGRISLAGATLT